MSARQCWFGVVMKDAVDGNWGWNCNKCHRIIGVWSFSQLIRIAAESNS
jgi:hypothetical protein